MKSKRLSKHNQDQKVWSSCAAPLRQWFNGVIQQSQWLVKETQARNVSVEYISMLLYVWLPKKLHMTRKYYQDCFLFCVVFFFYLWLSGINDSNAYLAYLREANKIRCALWSNTERWQEQLVVVQSAALCCAAVAQITDWIRMPTWRLCGTSVTRQLPRE